MYAWIYRENNTRDPCEHRKDQPAHHSKKGLMPPCGWRHYTQARSCLGRVDPGPEPSLSQAGDEGPAWRREEAPSRASPAGNQLTRQKGKPQPQGEESPNRSSPRKLFSAGEGHPPTRRRRAGLSRNVAFQRKLFGYEPIISRILSKTWHVDQQTERRTQTESTRRPFPMATERIRQPFPIATTNQETGQPDRKQKGEPPPQ